jgi:hypothetical protein
MTKEQKIMQEQAILDLKQIVKPGEDVYTIQKHVSKSGITRHLQLVIFIPARENNPPKIFNITNLVAKALGWRLKNDCLVVSGCGMDMGLRAVYGLGRSLFGCGEACRSLGYSRNGIVETDGGYLLTQTWI